MLWRFSLLFSLALSGMTAALAQSDEPDDVSLDSDGWNVFVGAGTLVLPNYPGDDDYKVVAGPFIRVTHGEKFFASLPEGIGYVAIEDGNFKAGPLATLNFGRDEDSSNPLRIAGGKTAELAGLGKIDPTISLGGFAEYDFGDIVLDFRAGQAVSGHDGATGKISLSYDTRILVAGPPLFLKAGPNIKLADHNYMQAFYGITATQSAASGLTHYKAGSGVLSYGVSGSLLVPVSYTAGFGFFGGYDRLSGGAADSPLIRERGRHGQLLGGVAFAKKF